MEVVQDVAYTGGRDGSVFQTQLLEENGEYVKVHQGSEMVTCVKYDDVHRKLWIGTTDSSVKCLSFNKLSSQSNTNKLG